jgi:hypothetical protein
MLIDVYFWQVKNINHDSHEFNLELGIVENTTFLLLIIK